MGKVRTKAENVVRPMETGTQLMQSMAQRVDPNFATYYVHGHGYSEPSRMSVVYGTKEILFGMHARGHFYKKPWGHSGYGKQSQWWSQKFGKYLDISYEKLKEMGMDSPTLITKNLKTLIKEVQFDPFNSRKPFQVRPENAVPIFGGSVGPWHYSREDDIKEAFMELTYPRSPTLVKGKIIEDFFTNTEEEFNRPHKDYFWYPRVSFFILSEEQQLEFPFVGKMMDDGRSSWSSSWTWVETDNSFTYKDREIKIVKKGAESDRIFHLPYNLPSVESLEDVLRSSPIKSRFNDVVLSHIPRLERLLNFYSNLAPLYLDKGYEHKVRKVEEEKEG